LPEDERVLSEETEDESGHEVVQVLASRFRAPLRVFLE
jgi:hypothetical protein